MEEVNKQLLLYLAERNMGENQETSLSQEDQTLLPYATFFRAVKAVEDDGLICRMRRGEPQMMFMRALAEKFKEDLEVAEEIIELKRNVDSLYSKFFRSYYKWRIMMAEVCSRCEEVRECLETHRKKCPKFGGNETLEGRKALDDIAQLLHGEDGRNSIVEVSTDTVSTDTDISYIDKDRRDRNMQVSTDTSSQEREEEEGKEVPQAQAGFRPEDTRAIMRHVLATSKRPEDDQQKMRAMKKEAWTVWTAGMKKLYGEDLAIGKPAGKDGYLIVQLIAGYGLELTKKIVVLYLEHWNELKAQNPWMKDTVPTVGMLWHFRQSMVAVVSGKASLDVVKRTADEYVDDGSEDRGRWPDRDDPKAAPPA